MKKLFFLILLTLSFGYELKEFVTCKKVVDLTPNQITSTFDTNNSKVFAFAYFTNIEQNKLIDFVWEKNVNGIWKLYADVELPIYAGARWRTFSSIKIQPYFTGKWRVSIVDNNQVIASKEFEIKDINKTKE